MKLDIVRRNLPLILTALLVLAARGSLADHYVVPSGSMEFTLLPGDRVLVDKTAYGVRIPFTSIALTDGVSPTAGEVVIFDSPEDGTRLIKRIVAVAGDRVALRGGHLVVNGTPLSSLSEDGADRIERFGARSAHLNLGFGGGPDLQDTRVPEGHVLVIGDSRGNSRDSRFFGFVREDSIYARALRIYFRSGAGLVWLPL